MYVVSAQPVGNGRKSLGVFGVSWAGEPVMHCTDMFKEISYYVDASDREKKHALRAALGDEWLSRQLLQKMSFNAVTERIQTLLMDGNSYGADDELHGVEFWTEASPPIMYGDRGERPLYCLKARFGVHASPKTPNKRRTDRVTSLVREAFRLEKILHVQTAGEEWSPLIQTCMRQGAVAWWGTHSTVAPLVEVACVDIEWTPNRNITSVCAVLYTQSQACRPQHVPPRVGEACYHTALAVGIVGTAPKGAGLGGVDTFTRVMALVFTCAQPLPRNIQRCVRAAHWRFSSALAVAKVTQAYGDCCRGLARHMQCGLWHRSVKDDNGRRHDRVYIVPVQPCQTIDDHSDCERVLVTVGLDLVGAGQHARSTDIVLNHGIHCDLGCLHERATNLGGVDYSKLVTPSSAGGEFGVVGVTAIDMHCVLKKQLASTAVRNGIVSGRPVTHVLSERGGNASLENIALHDLGVGKEGNFDAPLGDEQMAYCLRDAMLAFGVERSTMVVAQGFAQQANTYVYMDEAWRPNYPVGNTTCWARSLAKCAGEMGYITPTHPRVTHDGASNTQGLILKRPGAHQNVFELDLDKAYLSVVKAFNICPTTWRAATHPAVGQCREVRLEELEGPEHRAATGANRAVVIQDGKMSGFDDNGGVVCSTTATNSAYMRGCLSVLPSVFSESMRQMDEFQRQVTAAEESGEMAPAAIARVSRACIKVTNLAYIGIQAKPSAPDTEKSCAADIYAATRWIMCETLTYIKKHFATCLTCECTHFFDKDSVETVHPCGAPIRGEPLGVVYVITDSVAHMASPGDDLREVAQWVSNTVNQKLFCAISPVRLTADKCMRWFVHFGYPWADSFIGVPCQPEGVTVPASQWIRKGKMFNTKSQATYWLSRVRAAVAVATFTNYLEDEKEAIKELRRCIEQWQNDVYAKDNSLAAIRQQVLETIDSIAAALQALPGEAFVDQQSVETLKEVVLGFN